jgi:hypothetical protein
MLLNGPLADRAMGSRLPLRTSDGVGLREYMAPLLQHALNLIS